MTEAYRPCFLQATAISLSNSSNGATFENAVVNVHALASRRQILRKQLRSASFSRARCSFFGSGRLLAFGSQAKLSELSAVEITMRSGRKPRPTDAAVIDAPEEDYDKPEDPSHPDEYRQFLTTIGVSEASLEELMAKWDRPYSASVRRRTKIVATVGPRTCSPQNLFRMATEGVNVFRLNMSHADREWHKAAIDTVKTINQQCGWSCAVLLDVGSFDTIRIGDLPTDIPLESGDPFTLTVLHEAILNERTTTVSADEYITEVEEGQMLQLTSEGGSRVTLRVDRKTATDMECTCVEGGILQSRMRVRSISGEGAMEHHEEMSIIDFGIEQGVNLIALSFVKDRQTIDEIKQYIASKGARIKVIAKIECKPAMDNLEEIIAASDGIMVARGDLGVAIALEEVPLAQERAVQMARQMGKPVIVSTHFLESMNLYPTPTRAEVTDISRAVRQEADALMLTTETALGVYPFKAIEVMSTVAMRMESKLALKRDVQLLPPIGHFGQMWGIGEGPVVENIVFGATTIANNQSTAAILVFTKTGGVVRMLSRLRPRTPVYAFTTSISLCREMNLLWGVVPFNIDFVEDDSEETVQSAIELLTETGLVKYGDSVVIVFPGEDVIPDYCHMVQLRKLRPL
mmetsp:Transcript_5946/g.9135  ORF Transcript_5946/g.9135 Transcript_5946/m.9135 type:complete len:632 (-) Transcript_5946:32-1927(-)